MTRAPSISRRGFLLCSSAVLALTAVPIAALARAPDPTTPEGAPRYNLEIILDSNARRIEGAGTLAVAPADAPREEFRFAIGEAFADSFRLEIRSPPECAGPVAMGARESYPPVVAWTIRARAAVPAGVPVLFGYSYAGGEEAAEVEIFRLSPDGSYANGSTYPWYPQILYPVIANPPTLGQVRFRKVSGGAAFLAAGEETTTSADSADGWRCFESRQPSHFGFVDGDYRVHRAGDDVPLSLLLLSERPHVLAAIPRATQVMRLFEQWFGPHPTGEASIVEVRSERSFGSTLESLLFASSANLDEAWDDTFYAHELSHAWLGGKFNADRYFASEGLANYAALRAIDALHGPTAARQFRLYGRPGYNDLQCALGYFRLAAAGYDTLLSARPESYEHQQIHYSKGMLVLDMLSRRMGAERFHRVFRSLMNARPFQVQRWANVETALARAAGEDLRWFFAQWMERTGAPDLSLEWRADRRAIRGLLVQAGDPYRLSVPIAIRLRDGRSLRRSVEVHGAEMPFRFPLPADPVSVELDPDYIILRATPELKALAEAMAPLTRVNAGEDIAVGYRQLEEGLASPNADAFGTRFVREFALGRLYASEGRWAESVAAFRRAWEDPKRRADIYPWLLIRMARAAQTGGDDATARWALEEAVALAQAGVHSVLGEEASLQLSRMDHR